MFRTKNGYLAYIDFGLCSEVPAPVRESLVCALMHLIHGEYSRLAESLVGLALMRSDDVEIELPLLSEALRTALEPATPTERGVNRFTKFTLVGIVGKLLSLGPRFPFVFNDYFLNNLRCLGMLEGLAINADPEFSILGVVYPYVVRKILTDPAPRYRRALESLVIDSYGRMRWRRMDQLLRDVQSTAATTQFDTFRKRPLGVFADDLLESGQGLHTAFGPVLDELDIENRSDYSADLVLRFITSQSGRFLRRYIIVQYLSNIRNGMRRSIDGMVHISRPESLGLLEATAREMSDEEANVRTRQFFRRTPVSKRVRVLLRLVPEMIVPFMRMTSEMFVYLVTHFVKRMWGGMKTSGVTDTSDTNITRQRKWRAFDSTFLRRSMRTSTISTPKS